MKRIERDEWVAALRSGEFAQGRGHLARKYDGSFAFCCLGVKCELDVRAGRHNMVRKDGTYPEGTYGIRIYGIRGEVMATAMPTDEVLEAWGLPEGQANDLAEWNDLQGDGHMSFAQIADWIEENVPVED